MNSPLKWHGGKSYLAKKLVALMPHHLHYVEPYAGGLSVLLAKNPKGVSEIVNDINGDLDNFWRVLRSPKMFPLFQRKCEATPFSSIVWDESGDILENGGDEVFYAWAFFVRCRQSLAGRMESFSPLSKTRTRREMNEQVSAWLTAIEGLAEVHQRLKRVVILNQPALDVIRSQDSKDTFFYLDPPYLHTTRTATDVYDYEMSHEDHKQLLETILSVKGKVMISGYANNLYNKYLSKWHRFDFDLPNNAASGKTKRRMTESIWINYFKESKR